MLLTSAASNKSSIPLLQINHDESLRIIFIFVSFPMRYDHNFKVSDVRDRGNDEMQGHAFLHD
jgi:hypothetical protein